MEKGLVINDRYEVLDKLGRGGMGHVYKVMDYIENRIVALKIIKEELLHNRAVEHFKNEFNIAIHLNHPNVIKVYDFDVYSEKELYFFTMEYLNGSNLKKYLSSLKDFKKFQIIIQIARGLNYIHSRKIIHFDIKPDNIFIIEENGDHIVKIMDFGLASTLHEFTGKVRGTLSYIAPEVLLKKNVDYRADLYSLGMVIYHIFSGKLPFEDCGSIKNIAKAKMEESFLKEKSFLDLKNRFVKILITDLCRARQEERLESAYQLMNYLETALEISESVTEEDRESQFNDVFQDIRTDLSYLRESYLNFCLRGNKKSGKLTIIMGESGSGKTELITQYNIQAQLHKLSAIILKVEKDNSLINPVFRKLLFSLLGFIEKKENFYKISTKLRSIIDNYGNFYESKELIFTIKLLTRDILSSLSNHKSLVLQIDNIHNLDTMNKELYIYILYLVVDAPIFLVSTIEKGKNEELLSTVKNIFYKIPCDIIELNSLKSNQIIEFVAHFLNVETSGIPENFITMLQEQTQGNISLIKDYIRFSIRNSFLYKYGATYLFKKFGKQSYISCLDQIYEEKFYNLTYDDKVILLYLSDSILNNRINKDLIEILGINTWEKLRDELLCKKLINYSYNRGQKYYKIVNETIRQAVINKIDKTLKQEIFKKFVEFYSNYKYLSIVKYAYCLMQTTESMDRKKEVLKDAIIYAQKQQLISYLIIFLEYYIENFELPIEEKNKYMTKLFFHLLSQQYEKRAYSYFKILLYKLDRDSLIYAKITGAAGSFTNRMMEFSQRVVFLKKSLSIYASYEDELNYFAILKRLLILLFRSGSVQECLNLLQEEKSFFSQFEDLSKQISSLEWFFAQSKDLEALDLYQNMSELFFRLHMDNISLDEKIDFSFLMIFNLCLKADYQGALELIKMYSQDIESNFSINNIMFFYLKSKVEFLLGDYESAVQSVEYFENIVIRYKGVNGLFFILCQKINVYIEMRHSPTIIKEEISKALSIARQSGSSYYEFTALNLRIYMCILLGQWRNVEIDIKLNLTILPKNVNKKEILFFSKIITIFYYTIDDLSEFNNVLLVLEEKGYRHGEIALMLDEYALLFKDYSQKENILESIVINNHYSPFSIIMHLTKYFSEYDFVGMDDINIKDIIDRLSSMKYAYERYPVIKDLLDVFIYLLSSNYKEAVKKIVILGKDNHKKGFLFDCYYPILMALIFLRKIESFDKADYLLKKFQQVRKQLASHLPTDKRLKFIKKYDLL